MSTSVSVNRCTFQMRCLFLLILLSSLIYFNTLKGSFHFDDQGLLSRSWVSDINHFRKEVYLRYVEHRPILLFSYALNNALRPKEVFGFHLINLTLHIFVSILIFSILQRAQYLFSEEKAGSGSSRLSLITAFLFALHPLNTDAVSYISSRSAVLATFFYLLTLYVFITFFLPMFSKKHRGGMVASGTFCILGFYLALASKLIAMTLPVSLGILFIFFAYRQKKLVFNLQSISRQTIIAVGSGGLLFLTAMIYWVWKGLLSPLDQGMQLFGRGTYLVLQAKVIVFYYIKKFLFPTNLNVDVGFPFSTFWTDIEIPLAMMLIAAIVICVFKWGNIFLKLGTGWFFLTLLPTSSIVPLNDLAVEHHTYLPLSLGLCLVLGWIVTQVNRTWRQHFIIALFLILSVLTVARNDVWLNDFKLWKDAASKNPFSPRTQSNYGKAWYEKAEMHFASDEIESGQIAREQAMSHFQKSVANLSSYADRYYNKELFYEHFDQLAVQGLKNQLGMGLNPDDARTVPANGTSGGLVARLGSLNMALLADFAEPHYNIASLYLDLRRYADAEREYLIAIEIDPNYFSAYLGLGSVYNQTGQYEEAINWYKQAIERKKVAGETDDDPIVHLNLGEVYGKMGRYLEAEGELKHAILLSPSTDKAHYNLGIVYTQLGDYDKAEQAYLTALQNNNRFVEARFNLSGLYQLKKDWNRSTEELEKFLAIKGADARAYFQIAWNYQQLEKWTEARTFYLQVLAIDPGDLNARIALGNIYLNLKQYDLAVNTFEDAARRRPGIYQLHRQLGLIYWEFRKDKGKALEHLKMAYVINPGQGKDLPKLIAEISSS